MSKRLVVIDGKSVFYRGYYAMPSLATKDGMPTGGVYGFAIMALEIVKKLQPDYVCVAWDKAKTNVRLRREMYPEYKGNRKPAPPDFYAQLPFLYELLEALCWPLYEADDYEADDIMGAFAKQAGAKGIESYLVTSDLDMLQLVNEHTHIYTLKKGFSNIELFNVELFEKKYGVSAHQWIDVKALKGDSSDNIPGVAGVGEKTALDLIKKYKTLDGVYENLWELKSSLSKKLEKDKDMAYLSKKLVTLMVDMPLEMDIEKCKTADRIRPELIPVLRKLEFRNLLQEAESQLPDDEVSQVETTVEQLEPAKKVTFSASDFLKDTPRLITTDPEQTELWVSVRRGVYSVLPLDSQNANLLENLLEDGASTERENVIMVLANGPLVGHDVKPLFRMLLQSGSEWPGEVGHDTAIGAFLLNSLQRSRQLGDLLEQPVDMKDAGQTVAAIWKAYDDQCAQFEQLPELSKLAREIEFPTIYLLNKMEHRGILLDCDSLGEMSKRFETRLKEFEQKIYELAGEEFNIGSPAQLGVVLFEKIGLPTQGIKKGKTGWSTGAKELDKIRGLHPIADLITTWREYSKLKNTYIDTLPKLVDEHNKLHTTFSLDVAATGRLSSHDPNLQNIPTRTEIGQAIRGAFLPAKGNVFVSADYSQFELRLVAVMADDKQMITDFNNDIDIHTATASQVYGVPLEQVTKDMRRHAKTVNFGVLYGMSPHGLSVATGMMRDQAKAFIDTYFEIRKPVREYIDKTLATALETGYVETIFGRRRPTPDLKSSNFMVREGAKRAAANMPIQGTEADLMKMAMLKVEEKLQLPAAASSSELAASEKKGQLPTTNSQLPREALGEQLLQIHDSILVECPEKNAEQVAKLLKETMEGIYELPVKLKVDVTIGRNWGEL